MRHQHPNRVPPTNNRPEAKRLLNTRQAAKPATRLGVGVCGFGDRAANTLRLFFESLNARPYQLVDHQQADVVLVDLDSHRGKAYPISSGRPTILMSIHEPVDEAAPFLRKPLNAQSLLTLLSKIRLEQRTAKPKSPSPQRPSKTPEKHVQRNRNSATSSFGKLRKHAQWTPGRTWTPEQSCRRKGMPATLPSPPARHTAAASTAEQMADAAMAHFVGSAPDIDTNNREQLAHARYDVRQWFQGHLQQACQQARDIGLPVHISSRWGNLLIEPARHTIATDLSESRLRALCLIPIAESELKIETCISRADIIAKTPLEALRPEQPLDTVLWRVALWTSRGRVPAETRLKDPVFLRHWPNLVQLVRPPHALRIAALWTRSPLGLVQTAALLGIPQRHVFAFYTAAWSLGLADQGLRDTDASAPDPSRKEPVPVARSVAPPMAGKTDNRGILSRLLHRLKRNKNPV